MKEGEEYFYLVPVRRQWLIEEWVFVTGCGTSLGLALLAAIAIAAITITIN